MKVKLDENLGSMHVDAVRSAGNEVDRVHDEGLSGADDATVWQRAGQEGRFFITLDLDFADVRRYRPGTHPGLLLLRPRTKGGKSALRVLSRVLKEHPLISLEGCLVVADESNTRVRRPDPA